MFAWLWDRFLQFIVFAILLAFLFFIISGLVVVGIPDVVVSFIMIFVCGISYVIFDHFEWERFEVQMGWFLGLSVLIFLVFLVDFIFPGIFESS